MAIDELAKCQTRFHGAAEIRNRSRRSPLEIIMASRSRGRIWSGKRCYISHVAMILLVGVDLYFRGKLEALLPGHHLVTSDSADLPDLVIADIGRIEPDEVADAYPDSPILGYTNHKDTSGLRRAHEAGFDQVLAKSALVERAPQLVDELAT